MSEETALETRGRLAGDRAVEARDEGDRWQPSALAMLSEEDFETRVLLMKTEVQRFERIVSEVLEEGRDYGKEDGIPRPFLKQPGAERLGRLLGLRMEHGFQEEIDWSQEPPLYVCHVTSYLRDKVTERLEGTGHGSATTWETKYRYRHKAKDCPECGQPLRAKKGGAGFFCPAGDGGCGEGFKASDDRIKRQVAGVVANPDVLGLIPTVRGMAIKRSDVSGIRRTLGISGLFDTDPTDKPPIDPPATGGGAPSEPVSPDQKVPASFVTYCDALAKRRAEELQAEGVEIQAGQIIETVCELFSVQAPGDVARGAANEFQEKIKRFAPERPE